MRTRKPLFDHPGPRCTTRIPNEPSPNFGHSDPTTRGLEQGNRVLDNLFVPRRRLPDSTPRTPEPAPKARLRPRTTCLPPEYQRPFTPIAALADLPSTRPGPDAPPPVPKAFRPNPRPAPVSLTAMSLRHVAGSAGSPRILHTRNSVEVSEQAEDSRGWLYSSHNLLNLRTTRAVPPRHIPVSPWTAIAAAETPGDCPKQMDLLHLKQKQYNLFYAEKPVGTIRAKDGSKRRLSAPDCQRMEVCLE